MAEQEVEDAFRRSVDEGRRRMWRPMLPLLATGLVGGIDVGTGVLGLLLVEDATHNNLLAGLAFSIGFIALTLARSELFTENFLVPVTTVIARQARFRMLLRLWAGTLVANLAGGWIFTWLIIRGYPQLHATAIEAGSHYVDLGIGMRSMALAVIGGAVITLMTWMQHSTDSTVVKVIPAVTGAFLLAGGQLNHAIVNSLLMFSALHTGHAPFGYVDWAQTAGLGCAGEHGGRHRPGDGAAPVPGAGEGAQAAPPPGAGSGCGRHPRRGAGDRRLSGRAPAAASTSGIGRSVSRREAGTGVRRPTAD